MLISMMTIMLIVTGIAGDFAVAPVIVAEEGNGKVTLMYDLEPKDMISPTFPSGVVHTYGTVTLDDWEQTAMINSSSGALEITGTNPNGNGSIRRTGQCTVGRLSWNGNQYGWRIPNNSSSVEYYNIDLTGYESGDDVDVWACICARGGNAGPWISINGSGSMFTNVGTGWELRSISRSGGILEWNSADNWAEVQRTTSSSDTLGVGFIRVYINGAVPVQPPGSFNLTSPSNGATNQPLTGTLDWGNSSNADVYYVFLDTQNPPNVVVGTPTSSRFDYGTVVPLEENTTYYWDVIAFNEFGNTPSSNGPWHFTTISRPGSFSLISPSNGATNQPSSGTLSWATSSNATSYDVYFGTSNPPPFLRNVTMTSTSYNGIPGQTYYWYVVAKNEAGERECNSRFYFSTLAIPGTFGLISPSNGATNQPLSGTLSWGNSSNATSYDVYFGTSNPPPFLRNVTSTSTSYSGSPGQTYYWYVVAKNAAGERECNSRFYFSTLAMPGTFNLLRPPNGSSNQPLSGYLVWQHSSNVDNYDVYFGTSNPPSLLRNTTLDSTSYSGSVGQTYYWYVVAKNNAGNTECNSRFNFSTLNLPGTFNLISPANGDTYQPLSGTLSWEASSNATSYDVYFGSSNPPSFLRNVTTTSTSYSGDSGQTYYWYVVAKNGAGNTECNSRFHFSTPPFSAIYESTSLNLDHVTSGLKGIFPNPFKKNTSINYAVSQDCYLRLGIFNTTGASVRTLNEDNGLRGLYYIIWDGTDDHGLPVMKGVYFCRLQAGEFTETKKMVKTE